jgi:hypothetical protein
VTGAYLKQCRGYQVVPKPSYWTTVTAPQIDVYISVSNPDGKGLYILDHFESAAMASEVRVGLPGIVSYFRI